MTQLNYERKMTAPRFSSRRIQRWIRRTFSRENFVQVVKTLAWVAPLTILIWVYAEREQIKTDTDVSLPIEIRIDDPHRVVTLLSPKEKVVVATLQGSQANLDHFLSEVTVGSPLVVTIDPKLSNKIQEIPTEQALASVPLLKREGVTVESCATANLDVDIDSMQEVEVPVQAPPETPNIVGQPVFVPPTVKLRGPSRIMPPNPVAYVELAGLNELSKPGEHTIANVVIRPPSDDKRLSFVPTEVKATVTIRAHDVPHKFDSLPVWIEGDADKMGRYYVDVAAGSKTVPNITIVGPADKIELLTHPDFPTPPRAVLQVLPQDEAGRISRKPIIELPPDMGLHVLNPEAIQPIEFKLIDTQALNN